VLAGSCIFKSSTVVFPDTTSASTSISQGASPGLKFDIAQPRMDSRWDGRERRRGQSLEELQKRIRELQKAWEAEHCGAQPECPECSNEKPAPGVHRDNDEERLERVDAMLDTLRTRKKATRKTVVRWKARSSRRSVAQDVAKKSD